ncbi:MAG: YjfB family protein [Aquabacterium commune]|jgi:hypothetical protein|uniref:YjfB family protein n=2 Tax=Burkholderiales genera incertae sedis TaxID=224471 RepID=UPI001D73D578|nr:YjfB family protein [Aquabacterium sp.]MBT9609375.1 YjfB family protein [Aquabacterium sp.]
MQPLSGAAALRSLKFTPGTPTLVDEPIHPTTQGLNMNIGNDASVRAATSAAQSSNAGEVQMAVLKKAMQSQAAGVQPLLDSLPQQPKLATEGAVGTKVNTYA